MNWKLLDILNSCKHNHSFPPRHRALKRKENFNARGILQSSIAATEITNMYIESASAVLDEFSEIILKNSGMVGLSSEVEISAVFHDAFVTITNEETSNARGEFPDQGNLRNWIDQTCDEKLPPILEHLQRKIRLKDLDWGDKISSVEISGGQIGNLIVGSVNQSELTATVANVINQGGSEAELGRAIQNLIGVIGKLDERHKSEQTELFDLLKGFLQQINVSKEKRSPSAIKIIWERIVQISQVSHEVEQLVQLILPMIPALLGR